MHPTSLDRFAAESDRAFLTAFIDTLSALTSDAEARERQARATAAMTTSTIRARVVIRF